MTSFAYRILPSNDPVHVRLQVFAGPDEQHRANCGTLIMSQEEAIDFGLVTHLPTAAP